MLRRLLHIALNPFFQALVVASVIILFVPLGLNKYKAGQTDLSKAFDKNKLIFKDLDHDGCSELIRTFYNKPGNVAVSIHQDKTTYGQWNFKGVYEQESIRLMIGDYDHDSFDEIYLFTIENDSIFLHILEYSKKPELLRQDRFIDRVGKTLKDPDFFILEGEVTDMNGDDTGDLVFGITTGFSRQPRNVYIYDIMSDSLRKSPQSGAFIKKMTLHNLDDDQFKEIILSTFASDNFNEEPIPFTDNCSYLMVLDHDLNFIFPPIEFPVPTSSVQALPISSKSGEPMIIGIYAHASPIIHPGMFFIANLNGEILKESAISIDDKLFTIQFIQPAHGYLMHEITGYVKNDGIYKIDDYLNIKRYECKMSSSTPVYIDIDMDGLEEIIMLKPGQEQHCIYRHDFTQSVDLDFPIQSTPPIFSVKHNGTNPPQLSVQGDQEWKLFYYGINPAWRFRFLVWLGIYLAVLAFILAIRQLYSLQLKRRYETEKKIATLQLSSVKAQMEPHFIMNTINTIGSSIYRQKPDEAYNLLLNFSGMVRSLLMSSDKLTRSLKEEIEFVRNYLELEKTRFGDIFNYTVTVAEGINPEAIIPKMIIQLHTENALKHGLMPKKSGGSLEIDVSKDQDYLLITITDNGIGRKLASGKLSESTGKGMKILGQFFETYNKHNKNHLRQEIIDLYDDENKPAGTRINLFVPLDFNEGIF